MSFCYYVPTKILFGNGQLSKLHEQKLPGKKALVVMTCGNSVKKFGYLDILEKELKLAGIEYEIFAKILPNPIKAHVMEGAYTAKEHGCDFIIGFGGGSSIDSAKAIAIMATNDGDYWDYVEGGTAKGLPVKNDPLPIVAIATTAGTGTEADPWTVITNSETNEKIGYGYDKTFPMLSVVDPELMTSIPPKFTAYQGFDALFHSTEGYISTSANEMSDLFALKSISLVGRSLSSAVNNGTDVNARADVALASTFSGIVETISGCISEHSIEHALSAFHSNLTHGAGLIMISAAYYMHFAKVNACNKRLVDMAKALGYTGASKPTDFIDVLISLQKECGVYDLKMSDYGIKYDDLSKYVQNARETMGGLFKRDPAKLSDGDVLNILKSSYK